MSISDQIKREAIALGFDAVGIARMAEGSQPSAVSSQPSAPSTQYLALSTSLETPSHPVPRTPLPQLLHSRLADWLERGYQATMAWLERNPARRTDPSRVLPGCRSIICVGANYFTGHYPDETPEHGRIARYAWGQDYHDVLMPKLEALAARIRALAPTSQTRCYVDTGPVMEKAWAQEAGLGWIGKHSNLVSGRFGSWLLLGEVLTTLDLDPDEPGQDLCGSCTLCIKACPTGAIADPYVVDASRCISYLTIERRQPGQDIDPALRPRMGNRIFGCDDCLDVCPYNAQAPATQTPAFQPSRLALAPKLATLAHLSPTEFDDAFRGSPIRRARHGGFTRNVRIAQANESATPGRVELTG